MELARVASFIQKQNQINLIFFFHSGMNGGIKKDIITVICLKWRCELISETNWRTSNESNAARHSANQTFFSFQLFRMSWMKKVGCWRRLRPQAAYKINEINDNWWN